MGTEIYKTLLEDLNKGEEVALITKYNLETKKVEKNIYNLEELEGKNLEYVNKAKEKNLIANIKINDEESVLAEVFKREHRLIVFGAGHVGYHLCHFASKVGFNTIVVDDRPYFANKEKFGDDIQVICNTFENAFEILDIHEEDYVVIVTRGHKHDKFCLEKILSLDELNYIFQKYPQLMNVSQQTNLLYIMGLFSIEGQYVSFNVTNTKTVTEAFNQANKDQLIPLFEDLKNKAIPFTEDEVCNYHIQKDARWQYAFDVFKNNQITTFQLNPVGVYIGIRQLTKICEMSIPMSLFYV